VTPTHPLLTSKRATVNRYFLNYGEGARAVPLYGCEKRRLMWNSEAKGVLMRLATDRVRSRSRLNPRGIFGAGLASFLLGMGLLGGGIGAVVGSTSAGAQTTDWATQRQFPAAPAGVEAVSCTSASDCVAVGSNEQETAGLVATTTDGGATWTTQNIPNVGALNAVSCSSNLTCTAVGSDETDTYGVVLGTSDGGTTWASQILMSNIGPLEGVSCVVTSCVAVGSDETDSFGMIVGTTEEAGVWNTENLSDSVGPLTGVSCTSMSSCTAVGSDETDSVATIVATTNGGGTWNTQNAPDNAGPLTGVSCTSSSECWAVGTDETESVGIVLVTTDGGTTWANQSVPSTIGDLVAVSCTGISDCWAVGNDPTYTFGVAAATTDGGGTWKDQTLPTNTGPLVDVSCLGVSDCLAVGGSGGFIAASGARVPRLGAATADSTSAIMRAITDRGHAFDDMRTASVQPLDVGALSAAFVEEAVIVATTDGGSTWNNENLTSSGLGSLSAISCASSTACWALAIDGSGTQVVLATTDGWNTWTTQNVPSDTGSLGAISCPTTSDCWAVGGTLTEDSDSLSATASIVTTTDGGSTWTTQSAPNSDGLLYGVSCTSSSDCITVGTAITESNTAVAEAFGTTDGGVTWNTQNVPSTAVLVEGVSCTSNSDCVAVGADSTLDGVVLTTIDGGTTWTTQSVPTGTGFLFEVTCANSSDCWAGGEAQDDTGNVIATTDGGTTWNTQTLPDPTFEPVSISCPTSSTCWAAGETFDGDQGETGTGSILATDDGGATWIAQSIPDDVLQPASIACVSTSSCFGTATTTTGFSILSLVGVTTTPPTTTTTEPSPPPPGESSPYELYCPGSPVGNLVINGVSTTGTITPSALTSGSQFDLTNYQTQMNIPEALVSAFAALGNTTLTGSAQSSIDATGATPASVSSGTLNFDVTIPNPMPPTGIEVDLPADPTTIGPFTAAGGPISIYEDANTQLSIFVAGADLVLTCTAYPNNSAPEGIAVTGPPAQPVSPVIATAAVAAATNPYELFCPDTPVGNIVFNGASTLGPITPSAPTSGSRFDLTNYQTQVNIPEALVSASAALGNSTLSGSVQSSVDAVGATPPSILPPITSFDIPIPSPVPSAGLAP
jgi:photosystem II stability/assembly factor-like uncharacterized protein